MNDLETYQEKSLSVNPANIELRRSDISERMSIAQAYPRQIANAVQEAMVLVTEDQKTAESCFYMLPIGKEKIPGPSVRLAEIIAYCWGNLDVATRVSGNDGRFITAEAVCIDLQKNLRFNNEVQVSIRTKDGKTYSDNLQMKNANAAVSKALRNVIFRAVPKSIINKLYEAARKAAVGDVKTIAEKIKNGVAYFEKMGIQKEAIFSYFGVLKIEEMTADHFADMLAIKNSIKDNVLTIDTAFVANADTGEITSPHVDAVSAMIDGDNNG